MSMVQVSTTPLVLSHAHFIFGRKFERALCAKIKVLINNLFGSVHFFGQYGSNKSRIDLF
jgi:hypothetical protein